MKDIPFTIRNFQSREKVRLALGEAVHLLEVEREDQSSTAAPDQNQNQNLPGQPVSSGTQGGGLGLPAAMVKTLSAASARSTRG